MSFLQWYYECINDAAARLIYNYRVHIDLGD